MQSRSVSSTANLSACKERAMSRYANGKIQLQYGQLNGVPTKQQNMETIDQIENQI